MRNLGEEQPQTCFLVEGGIFLVNPGILLLQQGECPVKVSLLLGVKFLGQDKDWGADFRRKAVRAMGGRKHEGRWAERVWELGGGMSIHQVEGASVTWKERGSRWGKAGVGCGVSNRERREGGPHIRTGSETEGGSRHRGRASWGNGSCVLGEWIDLGQEAEDTGPAGGAGCTVR